MKKSVVATVLLTVIVITGTLFAFNQTKSTPATEDNTPQKTFPQYKKATSSELLKLVNAERKKVGVAPLKIDERLNASAQIKADDMFENDYFAHKGKDGKQGYTYALDQAPDICNYASENLVQDNDGLLMTSNDAVESWKTSPAHYKAMLNEDYKYTGFGVSGDYIVVEHFC